MSKFTLPATPGSIISFDTWADSARTERSRMVATLLPGQWEPGNGIFLDDRWGDSHADGEYFEVFIEEGTNHKVIFEAPAGEDSLLVNHDVDDLKPGSIVQVINYEGADYSEEDIENGDNLQYDTVCLAPGYLREDGTMADLYWVNAYGLVLREEDVRQDAHRVLVRNV